VGRLRIAACASTLLLEWIKLALDYQQRVHSVEEMTNTFSDSPSMIEIVWDPCSQVGG
jgi:hypothetical protein